MDEVRGLKGTLARFIPISGEDALFTDGEMTAYILDHCDIYFTPESRFFCKTELSDDRYYPYYEVILPRYQKEAEAFSDEAYRQTVEAKAFAMKIDFGHTSPNWEEILSLGFVGLKKRAEDYAAKFWEDPQKSRFYAAVVKIYNAAERFVGRVARKAEEEGRLELAQGLKNLLVAPPQNLFEGFQLLLLYHALQHFGEETWIRTFGRVDGLLYPLYCREDKAEAAALVSAFIREIQDHGMSENQPFAIGGSDEKGHSLINALSYVFIEEYKKLKLSVITEAVTKGIRSDRPMKPSGNIWFEVIPETWGLKKVKYLFKIKKDIAGKEGFTVLSITQRGVKPKDLTKNEGQLAENYSKYQIVCPGDFAMNHMDLLTGWIDISKFHGVTSPDYRVFTLIDSEKQNPHYFLYMMQMCYSNRIFYGLGQGVSGMGRWRLQPDKFLNFTIPVPSLDEQQEIVAYLDQQCAEIDRLIAKKEQIITELESYKKSLIYECVTGKLEVE